VARPRASYRGAIGRSRGGAAPLPTKVIIAREPDLRLRDDQFLRRMTLLRDPRRHDRQLPAVPPLHPRRRRGTRSRRSSRRSGEGARSRLSTVQALG
jgi:hypothetical protein